MVLLTKYTWYLLFNNISTLNRNIYLFQLSADYGYISTMG
jgi:hypothetical protein